jgi:hypothetical protein
MQRQHRPRHLCQLRHQHDDRAHQPRHHTRDGQPLHLSKPGGTPSATNVSKYSAIKPNITQMS